MSYWVIEDFRQGLDRRKHIMALPPGALYAAKNCNISRGGELEAAKAFVAKFSLPGGKTFGLLPAGGKLYTFGSTSSLGGVPDGIIYQLLTHPTNTAMTGVVHGAAIKGKPFVIATFVGGLGVFYNGALVTDWVPNSTGVTGYNDVATKFAASISASANYIATSSGAVVTITGRPGEGFVASATATNGGGVNDQSVAVATIQNATPPTSETLATATITFSGVTPGIDDNGFPIPVTIAYSITVNDAEILGTALAGMDDNGSAASVAYYINSYASSPKFTATVSGNVVTITAPAGSGATLNGVGMAFSGTGFATPTNFSGGSTASAGLPQKTTVTFSGTYEAADSYSVTLAGSVFTIAGVGSIGQPASFVMSKQSKTYIIALQNLYGSALGDATLWNSGTGSFVTDMSSELAGAEKLKALATFMGNLAIFARTTIQIWEVDADPANNKQVQVLSNIGTIAPRTVCSYGDSDVFFLSDTGLRSLKVRSISNTATLSDIGSPIDPVIIAAIKSAGADAQKAIATTEPIDGRFFLQIGAVTYVFSYFPAGKVSAWTTYETGLSFTDFAVLEQRLYARAGDNIYLLGGDNNDVFSPQPFDVTLPFLSARQLATLKHFTALDVACDGTFDVYMATDPQHPTAMENIATICNTTEGLGINPFNGEDVAAVSLRFVGRPSKNCKIANIAVHYEPLGEAA